MTHRSPGFTRMLRIPAWRGMARAWLALLLALAPFASTGAGADPAPTRYIFEIDEQALQGPPDHSALNRPLGPGDRLVARDGHFFAVGKDGKFGTADDFRVRLFGVNLSFGANFPDADKAVELARRLGKAGFNAVRLHHMDFDPDDSDTAPRSILKPAPYPTFNPTAVQRLRHFIGVLAEHGIYTNLNLYVSYRFVPERDGVPPFGNNLATLPIGAAAHIYEPQMVALQERFATELIRDLQLAGNPALAMVEISNEASLLSAWQKGHWAETVPPNYTRYLLERWHAWLRQQYGGLEQACAAWGRCTGGVVPLLSPHDTPGSTDRPARTWKTFSEAWCGLGMACAESIGTQRRLHDFLRFLADTDRKYFRRMRAAVHTGTDPLVPVTGTQMSFGGVLNFDAQAEMDYLDDHVYIDHPHFPQSSSSVRNWHIRNVALTTSEISRALGLGFGRDITRPFVLSEFNHPFPSLQAAESIPIIAGIASAQDWDGIFLFDYIRGSDWANTPANFTLVGDWGKYALVAQSASVFRQGLVSVLADEMIVGLPLEERLLIAESGQPGALAAHMRREHGVRMRDILNHRFGIRIEDEAAATAAPVIPSAGAQVKALNYDRAGSLFTIHSEQAQGIFGRLRHEEKIAGDIGVSLAQPHGGNIALWVTSLDTLPIAASRHLLASLGSSSVGTQPGSLPPRPKELVRYRNSTRLWTLEPDPMHPDQPSGSRHANGPVWLERQATLLSLYTDRTDITVYPLDGKGCRMAPLSAERLTRHAGSITLQLQATPAESSPWYEIVYGEVAARTDCSP